LAVLLPAACAAQQEVTLEQASSSLSSGDYDQALSILEQLAGDAPALEVRLVYVDALLAVGRYEEAESLAAGSERGDVLLTRRATALRARGMGDEALRLLEAASLGDVPDAPAAQVLYGELLYDRGEHERAREVFDGLIDVYNSDRRLSSSDLRAIGSAVRRLGQWESVYFHDAVKAYDEAIQADPQEPAAQLAMATLFLDKYDSGEAKDLLGGVLASNPKHPEGLLALARAHHFDGNGEAEARATEALEVNPKLSGALALLARMALESGDEASALEQIEEGLASNPESLELLSLQAAAHWLNDDLDQFRESESRLLALNPRYTRLYTDLADLAAQRRLYTEAADLAARGITIDSTAWEAHGHRGLNLLRTGAIDEGRVALETAFAGDPFNIWFKNTLDLLDTFENYDIVPTEHFELVLASDEAEVLAPYFSDVAERAYAALSERYGIEPPHPIRVEVFPSHTDFSVRTVGLAGIGALGVSFGPVLAMDSPSARQRGEFNWASTLWHEIAHSFHMALSGNRVPRWFTEGLAVFEQRRSQAGWGFAPSPAFLQAFQEGQLRPLSRLNEGFVRPRAPQEVPFSYLLASLATEYIEETQGFDALLAFLQGFEAGKDTPTLLSEIMGTDAQELDEQFDDYVRRRFDSALASTAARPRGGAGDLPSPGDFRAQLQTGQALLDSGDLPAAREHLERAHELFPTYGGPDSPLWFMMELEQQAGDPEAVVRWGEELMRVQESHLPGARTLVDAYRERQDAAGEIAAWTRVIEIAPLDPDPHQRLADLWEVQQDYGAAARAWAGVVALDPPDRVEAQYRLANARFLAGDVQGARTAVLSALESAPTYGPALDLLLRIRGGGE